MGTELHRGLARAKRSGLGFLLNGFDLQREHLSKEQNVFIERAFHDNEVIICTHKLNDIPNAEKIRQEIYGEE